MWRIDESGFDRQRRVILPVDAEAEFQTLFISCLFNRLEQRLELFNIPGGVNRDDVDSVTGQVTAVHRLRLSGGNHFFLSGLRSQPFNDDEVDRC